MPKLWSQTIASHRREVRDAILETAARLVRQHGLLAVSMSRIAEDAGIGRATLYKYFPDVEAILRAWHAREIARHLEQLGSARDHGEGPTERLTAMLETYATISGESRGHRDRALAAWLHRDEQVSQAERALHAMVRDVITEGVSSGELRDDVPPDELATFCLSSLAAARTAPSKAAVQRLVSLTLAALRPPR